jgi:signal peptidase II
MFLKKTPNIKQKKKRTLIIIPFLILFDFLTKNIFQTIKNKGVFFGLFPNNLLWIFVSIFFVAIIFLLIKKSEFVFPYALILSGIFGNLIDRIFYFGVRDFIYFSGYLVFNIADIYILGGAFLLIIEFLKK